MNFKILNFNVKTVALNYSFWCKRTSGFFKVLQFVINFYIIKINEETFNIKLLIVCIVICLLIWACFCSFYRGYKLINFPIKFHEKKYKMSIEFNDKMNLIAKLTNLIKVCDDNVLIFDNRSYFDKLLTVSNLFSTMFIYQVF